MVANKINENTHDFQLLDLEQSTIKYSSCINNWIGKQTRDRLHMKNNEDDYFKKKKNLFNIMWSSYTSLIPKAYVWCSAPPFSLRLYFFIICCREYRDGDWRFYHQHNNWQKKLESMPILKFNFQTSDNDPRHPSDRSVIRPKCDSIFT
jgi:hypothetical protein